MSLEDPATDAGLGRRFLARNPSSPYAPRLRQVIEAAQNQRSSVFAESIGTEASANETHHGTWIWLVGVGRRMRPRRCAAWVRKGLWRGRRIERELRRSNAQFRCSGGCGAGRGRRDGGRG